MGLYDNKRKMMQEREQQGKLREKYGIEEKVVVKETGNMVKFLMKSAAGLIRAASLILLLLLAAAGLTTLLYPELRNLFFLTVRGAFSGLYGG